MIDAREEIEALVAFEGRGPGTDAERRAGQHLRRRLEGLGRDAAVEPIWIRPGWPIALTAYALMGLVASIAASSDPLAGGIIAGVALLLTAADLGGRVKAGRVLAGRRASQNVVSRERSDRPGTLVLVAHYDVARGGMVYGSMARVAAALGRRVRRSVGPFEPLVWSLAVVLACAVLQAVEVESIAVTIVQFAATVVLILAIPLLANIALSDFVPGASDNASGVATVLRLAERYGGDLDHFDVWVLFTGAEEALSEGMSRWLRAERKALDRSRTIFLNVDTVGNGAVRYTRREGPLLTSAMHPRLTELCDQLAAEDAEERRYGARRLVSRSISDALAARRARFPAVTVSCREDHDLAAHAHRPTDTPDRIDDAALERAFGFCSELVELIDERIGPRLSDREQSRWAFRSA